jgi:T5SS/PEP-CTERM-associated repeat protein
MKQSLFWLITAGALLLAVPPVWPNTTSCSVVFTADKTAVCIGETVTVTEVKIGCINSTTTTSNYVFGATGTNTISDTCTACDESSSTGYLTIYVLAFTNLSPASVTMCPGSYETFTTLPETGTLDCEPVWSVSPTNAGTLSPDGGMATFTLSASYTGATAIVSAVCGAISNSATVTVGAGSLTIYPQPISQIGCTASNATFTVAATGSHLRYQWRKDGVNLVNGGPFSGVTNATLTISNVFAASTYTGSIASAGSSRVADLRNVHAGDPYTYQASGCIAFENDACPNPPCATADPDGNVYFGGGCTNFASPPIPVPPGYGYGYPFPGYAAWSMVGFFNYYRGRPYVQLGTNGMFQAAMSGSFQAAANVQHFQDNTGSWNVSLTHTLDGVYDCIVSSDCGSQISTGATLSVSTPCDGIPDWWRLEYFGTTTTNPDSCASCVSTDLWAHGLTNLQLYQNPSVLISNNYSTSNDGIPDWWRVKYFGSVTNTQSCATCDPEGDCWINLEKYANGMDPWSSYPNPIALPYLANYETNNICQATNWPGDLVIGSNTFADVLVIRNGGSVVNDDAYLGYEPNSSNNTVLVTDPGSQWITWQDAESYIGLSGSGNSLIVCNGAYVYGGDSCGFVGENATSSGNLLLVTGANSVWDSDEGLSIGEEGAGNRLVVSDGGRVSSGDNCLLGTEASSSSNNTALVTDPGSLLQVYSGLYVGVYGAGNSLVVSNGGQLVVRNDTALGAYDLSSSKNSIVVTDPGTVWTNSGNLFVGVHGAGNSLVISNGAQVVNLGDLVMGSNDPSSSNNTAVVTGPGSVWSNAGSLSVGENADYESLTVSDGAMLLTSSNLYIGLGELFLTNCAVTVTSGTLTVGDGEGDGMIEISGGTLTVNAGSAVTTDYLFLPNWIYSTLVYNGGTIAAGTLEIDNDSVVQFALGTNSHPIAVTSNLILGVTLVLTNQDGFTPTNQTLFTYGGTLTDNGVEIVQAFGGPLTCGTLPTANEIVTNTSYAIDESVAGQVNLIGTVIQLTRTLEGAVSLRWNSQSNAIYRIESTDGAVTDAVWDLRYDYYPSHGASTFWTDTGDYVANPVVSPPSQVTSRCYRVTIVGSNVTPPQVTLTWPTNTVVLSGNVTVSVTATGASDIAGISLFVDGEKFDDISGDETNFVINTCEWSNGVHTLFAVAEDTTGMSSTPNTNSISEQFAASPYVTVVFSNYVSQFWFSQPFFEPELGETQQISAVFTTNSNWTLTILDSSSNTVRSATGTGATMNSAWDGNDNGANPLPADLYDFAVSATAVSPCSLSGTSGTTLRRSQRVRGKAGTFGIAYQDDHPCPGPGIAFHPPINGLGGYVSIYHSYLPYGPIPEASTLVNGFGSAMSKGGWRAGFPALVNDNLTASALRKPSAGGSSAFEQVNIGFMVLHGTRGLSGDFAFAETGPQETYWATWQTWATDYDWVRFSDCEFGSSTNLRWMASATCTMLNETNFWDMFDKLVLPVGSNLHLFLGAHSTIRANPKLGEIWAKKMTGGGLFNMFPAPEAVRAAWYDAGRLTERPTYPETTVDFAVMGWPACRNDYLRNYSSPDSGDPANIYYDRTQVYP